jgi:hypothetical protein
MIFSPLSFPERKRQKEKGRTDEVLKQILTACSLKFLAEVGRNFLTLARLNLLTNFIVRIGMRDAKIF